MIFSPILRKRFWLLLICCIPLFANAQYGLIKYRQLTWDDFKGKPDNKNQMYAYAPSKTYYTYTWTHGEGDIHLLAFNIISGFDANSAWSEKWAQNEDLLKHEQTHFDIHELYTRKMVAALKEFTYSSNFKIEIKAIYDKYIAEANAVQTKFDQETEHYRDTRKEKIWESYIQSQLSAIPPNY